MVDATYIRSLRLRILAAGLMKGYERRSVLDALAVEINAKLPDMCPSVATAITREFNTIYVGTEVRGLLH